MGFFEIFKKKNNSVITNIEKQPAIDNSIKESANQPMCIPKQVEDVYQQLDERIIKRAIDSIAKQRACELEYNDCEGYLEPYLSDVNLSRFDPLLEESAQLIITHQQCSTSLIQHKFSIGYNRAGRIINQLEELGIIGHATGDCYRKVLVLDDHDLKERIKSANVSDIIDDKFKEDYKNQIEERTRYYLDLIQQEREEQEKMFVESEKARIKQQILEKRRKRELHKQAMQELKEEGVIENIRKREPIPQEVQDAVWRRDGGRCVKCGSQENLEFDHIIPFSKGGSNTVRNLQLLCQKCNREKSNHIG